MSPGKHLPVPVNSIHIRIQCPSHQVWPRKRVAITGVAPLAWLNLKTFEWCCDVCGDHGLLTRALRLDFQKRSKA